MSDICSPARIRYAPNEFLCQRVTVQSISQDFDVSQPLLYIDPPTEPKSLDLHIVLFNNYTVYYVYAGTQWQVEGYK